MRRRAFLTGFLPMAGKAALRKQEEFRAAAFRPPPNFSVVTTLAGRRLTDWREHFAREQRLTVAHWEKNGVDRQHGGYLIAGAEGKKRLYHQGRVLWLFSYWFNHAGGVKAHFEAARQGHDALVKTALLPDGHWATELTRDWKPRLGFFDIYADVYMALGLGEYARATGDGEARRLAVATAKLVMKTVLAPDYQGQGLGAWFEPGIKRLGTWLHLLSALTPLLRYGREDALAAQARFCVRAIVEKHWQRDGGFAYEFLDNEWKPYTNTVLDPLPVDGYYEDMRTIDSFHSLQAAWLVMEEALRTGNRALFLDAMELGFDTLSIHWDDGGNCGLNAIRNPVEGTPALKNRKITAILAEAFVFLLMAIEHTHSALALQWFERVAGCAYQQHHHWDRGATLHEPRGILFSLQSLERMIARQGRVSGSV